MTKSPSPGARALLPLTPPVFHILIALADGERHGYAIMQDVALQTNDGLQLGPGTLYGCIKRMLTAGLIEESDERPGPDMEARRPKGSLGASKNDERRRYYSMTSLGRCAVRAEAERLADAVTAARSRRLLAEGKV